MSCDNIPHNGPVCRGTVVGLPRLSDPDFADWMRGERRLPERHGRPHHPRHVRPRTAACSGDEYGIEDGWPVFCEDFIQWVLEDDFPLGRPALEEVGVEFVRGRLALRDR